jgi:hypothetical protein
LGNQVKTCPDEEGKVEGAGVFSMSVDYTDAQATRTTTQHIEVRADAKYKGQVGDNALLNGPVNAEIDYSYTSSGKTRESNGALTTPAGSNIQQHISIPVVVAFKAMAAPDVGAFSGGDPTKGHYSEAVTTGLMLSYWAGVYYGIAQMKWYGGEGGPGGGAKQGMCVDVVSIPRLYGAATARTETKVKVVKPRLERVKAHYFNAHTYTDAGRIQTLAMSPIRRLSDVGPPME